MTFWVAGAVVTSAVIGSQAAKSAAGTQAQAAQQAGDVQKQIFERQVELQEPWRQAGINALGKMGTGFTGQVDLTQDPGYAFRMSEGMKALERSAAARGGLLSGSMLKGAQRFGQDLASQEYQNAYNRALTQYNTTAALAGVGQTATNQLSGAASQYGQNASEAIQNAAAARASGYVGSANALSSALGTGLNYMQGQNYLNVLQGRSGSPTGWSFNPQISYGGGAVDLSGVQTSDRRLKTNIVQVGTRSDGLGVYEFDYVWGGGRQVGLMAQEVMRLYPEAVGERDGYLTVDYSKV